MICRRCESARKTFPSEIAIHFPGLDGLKKPIVWLFPEVRVCLKCGTAEFVVPEKERDLLLDGTGVDDAIPSS